MADTNAGITRLFGPWGGHIIVRISATDHVVFNIVEGSVSWTWPFREKMVIHDRGAVDAILDGNHQPGRVTCGIRYTDGPGAGELYTLLSGTGTAGEAKFVTVEVRIFTGPGASTYDKWTFENCALAEQPVAQTQGDGTIQTTLNWISKDTDPAPTAV